MSKPVSEYFTSEEFAEKMKRVSAESRPFDNSASSEQVYRALAQAAHDRRKATRA